MELIYSQQSVQRGANTSGVYRNNPKWFFKSQKVLPCSYKRTLTGTLLPKDPGPWGLFDASAKAFDVHPLIFFFGPRAAFELRKNQNGVGGIGASYRTPAVTTTTRHIASHHT